MARKQPTGFIGKKAARIWSGVMGFGVLMCYCIGIYIGGDNRPIKNPSNNNIDPPKNSAPGDYPDGYYEPPTIVKPGQENITIPTETIIPVIPEDTVIKPGANTSTDIPSDDILTKFTSLAKTSIYNLTGNEPNLAVTEIMIFNKGTHIKVDGELYLNGNHNNFSAIVTNPNTSLEIFNKG